MAWAKARLMQTYPHYIERADDRVDIKWETDDQPQIPRHRIISPQNELNKIAGLLQPIVASGLRFGWQGTCDANSSNSDLLCEPDDDEAQRAYNLSRLAKRLAGDLKCRLQLDRTLPTPAEIVEAVRELHTLDDQIADGGQTHELNEAASELVDVGRPRREYLQTGVRELYDGATTTVRVDRDGDPEPYLTCRVDPVDEVQGAAKAILFHADTAEIEDRRAGFRLWRIEPDGTESELGHVGLDLTWQPNSPDERQEVRRAVREITSAASRPITFPPREIVTWGIAADSFSDQEDADAVEEQIRHPSWKARFQGKAEEDEAVEAMLRTHQGLRAAKRDMLSAVRTSRNRAQFVQRMTRILEERAHTAGVSRFDAARYLLRQVSAPMSRDRITQNLDKLELQASGRLDAALHDNMASSNKDRGADSTEGR